MCKDRKKDQMICVMTFSEERRAFIFCNQCTWQREIEFTDGLAEETKKLRKPMEGAAPVARGGFPT